MDFLRTLPLSLTIACYSPDVRDCTVACESATDCAPSQVCGSDGFCASADVAGSCAAIAQATDAGIDAPPDATAPIPTVTLRIRIDGRGTVRVPTVGDCDAGSGSAECFFDVVKTTPITLSAVPKNTWRFDRWEDACKAQPSTCVLAPTVDVSVRAKFVMIDN